MTLKPLSLCVAIGAGLLGPSPAPAHEFIPRITDSRQELAAPGGFAALFTRVLFSVVSTHVFMRSEELEAKRDVEVALVHPDGKRMPAEVREGEDKLTYIGEATFPGSGTAVLWVHRRPQVWASTQLGTIQTTKSAPDARNSFQIEKFGKALVNASESDRGFARVLGDRLEIVPITNPASLRVGGDLTVKVLFDGQPMTTKILATYDGFSTDPNTYAFYTEGRDDGIARVRVTAPGTWMVRVEVSQPEVTAEYDRYVARAVLVFDVAR